MIERSPDPHFTQTQNTNRESLLTANSHNYQKDFFSFVLCWVFVCLFVFPRSFFRFAIETTILLVPEGGKKNCFSLS